MKTKTAPRGGFFVPFRMGFFGLDKTNVIVDYIPISVTKKVNQEMTEDYEDYSH